MTSFLRNNGDRFKKDWIKIKFEQLNRQKSHEQEETGQKLGKKLRVWIEISFLW